MQISDFKYLGRVQPLEGYREYYWFAEVTVAENGEQVRREVAFQHDRETSGERGEWYFTDTGEFCPPEVQKLYKRWVNEKDRINRIQNAKEARQLLNP